MRTFLAIDVPKQYYEYLNTLQEKLKIFGRFSFVHHFHITLAFFGEKTLNEVQQIVNCIESFSPLPSFRINVGPLNHFNNRVIYLEAESEELIRFANSVRKKLPYFDDNKSFKPHITLVRVKQLYYPISEIMKLNKEIKSFSFDFNLVLYESILKTPHPEYRVIKRF